ncbi:hypothetical protein [uncultured Cellulomonas sp.]|uniref:hypothetical protein n=1 Tax=uncultured Cellulomonas sp. TaxID=189682 RepID=UPI0028ED3BF5|nr:hypothetical protein [uncultured Cellulomonas sp.]
MTDPYVTGTADHTFMPPPRPSSARPRRWLLTVLAAATALTAVIAVAGHSSEPPDDRATAPVVIDGTEPVQLDGALVRTRCFSYRMPEGLALSGSSAGCATAVGVGEDDISEIQVRMQAGSGGDVDEVATEVRAALVEVGTFDVDTVRTGGRDAVRIRGVDGWGLRRTSYVVPLPEGVFSQDGVALDSIWLTSPVSPEFDAWVATVLDSLEVPGD